jgi:sulfate transporter 4
MYPEAQELEGILMLRIDAPLFFANVESVKGAIRKYENAYEKRGRTFEFVILDFSPVTDIDASAVHFLQVGSASLAG